MTRIDSVDAITGARLHFGLLCGTAETGWIYGGVGLMVKRPGWTIRVRRSSSEEILSEDQLLPPHDSLRTRISETISRCRSALECDDTPAQLRLLHQIPLHSGLGAGTQLTLAIASAMELLFRGRILTTPAELSRKLGRGSRSAVGTEGFRAGGFIVDRGIRSSTTGEHELLRLPIPELWRFVLIRPMEATGLSGSSEADYFNRRRTMNSDQIQSLSRRIERELVPAVQQNDLPQFAESLQEFGFEIGQFYAPAQGGVFSHPLISELAEWLQREQISGAAQSSWGPGICIPAQHDLHAGEIVSRILKRFSRESLHIEITSPLNHGGVLRTEAQERAGRFA